MNRDTLVLGPWRRRRRMARLLAQLDRADARASRAARSGRVRDMRRRPGDRARQLFSFFVAVVLVLVIGGSVAHERFGLRLTRDGFERPAPLGRPPVTETGVGSFSFSLTQSGSNAPVAYDPCREVEYVVNDTLAPSGSEGLVQSAVEEISAATGLVFAFTGHTDEIPVARSSDLGPRREPVVVAWTTPDAVEGLRDEVAGLGGSSARLHEDSGRLEYVTGMVALDAPQLSEVIARPNGPAQARAIVVHELGHLVGLDHVEDPGELMHADNVGLLTLGPGDREGLAALGAGPCFF